MELTFDPKMLASFEEKFRLAMKDLATKDWCTAIRCLDQGVWQVWYGKVWYGSVR
jgi:hypothetical protein